MGVNSPIPVRLEDETRKAAKILRSFIDSKNNGLDKVVPRHVLERAAGFAIFSVFKMGFVFSARAGSGIVIARTQDGSWSPPSAIGLGGFGVGGQMGAEVTDFLIVLNSRAAVTSFMSAGSLTLGGNLSVAVGPLGRNAEGSGAVNTKGQLAAMYSYSKTKGLFGGVSVEGSVIVERQDANRLAYGGNPSAKQILSGAFDAPDWTYPLIDQLNKATGLPGGQAWRVEDEEGEGGGMGYHRRGQSAGGGYVFGEGLGAEGHTPPSIGGRKRSGSLFGGGGSDKTGGSPGRPSSSRRSSTLNPFSKNPPDASPGKAKSSESYNSGRAWDSNGDSSGSRSRSGSVGQRVIGEVPQPFSYMSGKDKDKDLLGDWGEKPDPFSDLVSRPKQNANFDTGGEKDLLGTWSSDGTGLSASFARMSTGGQGGRSRSDSRPTPFADILEDQDPNPSLPSAQYDSQRDYTPHETVSAFARKDFSALSTSNDNQNGKSIYTVNPSKPPLPQRRSPTKLSKDKDNHRSSMSMFGSKGDFSPFEDAPVGRLRSGSGSGSHRPFEEYSHVDEHDRAMSPRPDIKLKTGLGSSSTNDGYARAVGLFEFKATDSTDLGFKAGELVVIVDRVGGNGEWWKGRSGDGRRTGIFPTSYVEVIYIPKDLRGGVGRSELRRRAGGNEFD